MQFNILAIVGLVLGTAFTQARPVIDKSVQAELEKGSQGVIMVSFDPAIVRGAYSPSAVLLSLKKWTLIRREMTLNEFVSSGAYAQMRGDYVHAMVHKKHKETKEKLKKLIPQEAIISSIPISNLFLLRNLPGVYDQLKDLDWVQEISTNQEFQVPKDLLSPHLKTSSDIQWNVEAVGATQVWDKGREKHSRGEGIVFGIADTGVLYTHPVLKDSYRGLLGNESYDHNYNWWDGVREAVPYAPESACPVAGRVPCDDEGHGTHCTSTAGGSEGFGVAPGAKWIGCRNMQAGVGSTVTYLSCLNFFLAPHDLNVRKRSVKNILTLNVGT